MIYPLIDNFVNPVIGDLYTVRTVKFYRNNIYFVWPVFGESHKDSPKHANPNEHYHIDWRFMLDEFVYEHRYHNRRLSSKNGEYFTPIMGSERISEFFMAWKYLRDFPEFPQNDFLELKRQ